MNSKLLKNVHLVLADSDKKLSNVIKHSLRTMGFHNVTQVSSADEALEVLRVSRASLLITEWTLGEKNGISLITEIRRGDKVASRILPIIMLTGKGERPDVITARDAGVNEFVIKPFRVTTLYDRMEKVVEHPRNFIACENYAGPDRRRHLKNVKTNRRFITPRAVTEEEAKKAGASDGPQMIKPDFAFRKAMNTNIPLSAIITKDLIDQAQQEIFSIQDESKKWIVDDLFDLKSAYERMARKAGLDELKEARAASLSIKSRAGTFGMPLASSVARLLYLFLCSDYNPGKQNHNLMIKKHIEVLEVLLGGGVNEQSKLAESLLHELEAMLEKFR